MLTLICALDLIEIHLGHFLRGLRFLPLLLVVDCTSEASVSLEAGSRGRKGIS